MGKENGPMHPHQLMEQVRLGKVDLPLDVRLTIKRHGQEPEVTDGVMSGVVGRTIVLERRTTFDLFEIANIEVRVCECHMNSMIRSFLRSIVAEKWFA
jgi:CO dehydrogenase nickel-insertion accessory protein CooC1